MLTYVVGICGAFIAGCLIGASIEHIRRKDDIEIADCSLQAWEQELALKQERLNGMEQALYAKDEEIHRTDKRPWKEEP